MVAYASALFELSRTNEKFVPFPEKLKFSLLARSFNYAIHSLQSSETKRKTGGASLSLPKVRRNPLVEIIAVNTGCLNACTYCKGPIL